MDLPHAAQRRPPRRSWRQDEQYMVGQPLYNDHAGHEAQGNEELEAWGATRLTQCARADAQPTAQRDANARGPQRPQRCQGLGVEHSECTIAALHQQDAALVAYQHGPGGAQAMAPTHLHVSCAWLPPMKSCSHTKSWTSISSVRGQAATQSPGSREGSRLMARASRHAGRIGVRAHLLDRELGLHQACT